MHLASLNLTDLLLGLWRGVIDCDPKDDRATWDWMVLRGETWTTHGAMVGAAVSYLPGSFDRPPRNPADKISSGYKAWEFLTYVFGYCPAMLYGILPIKYWKNFCKLVLGVRLLHQHRLTRTELGDAHKVLIEFCEEFEHIYYQRRPERLHFCRQSVHQMRHVVPESKKTGLLPLTTQWAMERVIGDLGQEIKQPSNPFANLSQRGLRRARVNALKAMIPDLDPEKPKYPRGSMPLDDGYVLLRAKDTVSRPVLPAEGRAILDYLGGTGRLESLGSGEESQVVVRWARLRLPNTQIARSAWKENLKPISQVRMARNVKMKLNAEWHFGEVQYYFCLHINQKIVPLAMVSMYGPPDADLLKLSSHTVWSCQYQGQSAMKVVHVNTIQSVVAMVPHQSRQEWTNRYFVVEKMGLDIAYKGVGEAMMDE
ncbi:hypothetical protein DENSPDRAFT_779875 [Dentipellis sp. KUC8613]|nr:hypothetical protein DENSPDRAFT_779875 [Dentipellis sp. KUC8613]